MKEVLETKDIKFIIAANIKRLRSNAGMTQLELAEKLNYSDKAISKWERAEALPDITVLSKIADIFGITVDEITSEPDQTNQNNKHYKVNDNNRKIITLISVFSVWLIATTIFVLANIFSKNPGVFWITFVYAIPVSAIVLTVFISLWFNRRKLFPIISILMWSTLTVIFLQFIIFDINIWHIFLLGIPGQIIIVLCSRFSYGPKKMQ